jgi:sialic acid synthase SpsE
MGTSMTERRYPVRQVRIGDQGYCPERVLVIAELGTAHGADLAKAKALVDAAGEAGADCVKFQIVYADEILHPNTGNVPLPGGSIPLHRVFKNLEVPLDFFATLKEYVERRGLIFLCTPFGPRSARELSTLKPKAMKLASPELNYTQLLEQVASYRLPTFLSTGVSRLGDIEDALEFFGSGQACLLHCVTAYPAPEQDYNLRVLANLGAVFSVPVGLSDHSLDPELIPALGTAMGACVLEKHFCLSRTDPGLDDPIALPPPDFARMVRAVREASAEGPERTLRNISKRRGKDTVAAILGDGVKRLAPSESANYERTNRSLHALRDIGAGETIPADAVGVLRTEKILRPGLPPRWLEAVVGRKAVCPIPAGEGIRFEDI